MKKSITNTILQISWNTLILKCYFLSIRYIFIPCWFIINHIISKFLDQIFSKLRRKTISPERVSIKIYSPQIIITNCTHIKSTHNYIRGTHQAGIKRSNYRKLAGLRKIEKNLIFPVPFHYFSFSVISWVQK